jgi:hypothetical protein
VVNSTFTRRLTAIAAVLIISYSSQSIPAQPTSLPAQNPSPPRTCAAPIDAVTWRALGASWNKVQQIIDNGKPPSADVPVYIISRFQEDPLSDDQKSEIVARARKADLWRDIWFITVSSNFDGRYSASVYFKPDVEQGVLRQGKMLPCSNWIKVEASPGRFPPLRGMLSDYVQVSSEPPECFQPDASNLPFAMPSGFSLDELAEIIGSIRTPNLVNPKLETTRPILGIRRQGDNVEVEMGIRQGALSGRGNTWKCKKTNGVWAVVDTAEW